MPDIFAPYCQICKLSRYRRNGHLPTENNYHFIFACPKKMQVWTTAVVHYIDPPKVDFYFLHYYNILKLQSNITRITSVPFEYRSLYQVFACIIQATWVVHYQTIFEDIPFVLPSSLGRLHKTLAQFEDEETLHLHI
ncbi:hypothetical protein HMPREF1544_07894 [Mucor circinelloides 1006PhL]|uniref:Uncharacterized protein n=1 Tax=Mucor circinelloides f. circinelloides (strain 1006PhL) TaxID=1220926 RepID=S2J5E6_MUCC1|nr:hypothetical protein HMPREF1544_07894 [Mucor circinelloides 1006PhL]KAG1111601.1 hypothetical protein G6F42_014972 [Rhizopus arrhizus]